MIVGYTVANCSLLQSIAFQAPYSYVSTKFCFESAVLSAEKTSSGISTYFVVFHLRKVFRISLRIVNRYYCD